MSDDPRITGDGESYANIRDGSLLGPILQQRIVEITQHDEEEFHETGEGFVCLHFENGYTLRLAITEEEGRILLTPP